MREPQVVELANSKFHAFLYVYNGLVNNPLNTNLLKHYNNEKDNRISPHGFGYCSRSRQCTKQAVGKTIEKRVQTQDESVCQKNWKVFGTSRTLEVALLLHYEKLTDDGVKEITTQTISTNKNLAKDKLMMNACTKYAQEMGSNIKGRITGDMASKLTPEELEEFEQFYAAYENNVSAEIKGELHNTFCIYREIKHNGVPAYEFEAYFIVDIDAASAARIRAFENAAKESAVAQKYAEKVSEFIRNGSDE